MVNMASTSNLVIAPEPAEQSPEKIFTKKEKGTTSIRWFICFILAAACLVLLIVYFAYHTNQCVLYINGTRTATLGERDNCSSIQLELLNQTDYREVRTEEIHTRPDGVIIAFGVCLSIFILTFIVLFVIPCIPCNHGNYVSCRRRMTCCCKPVSLKHGINRYVYGYINDEAQFREIVQSGQENVHMIIERLKQHIPEVTFDVLMTGSLQERLGKPNIVTESKPILMKSILNTDYDVMLTPQTVLAAATSEPAHIKCSALFNLVTLQNITPGFVWLKLNKDFQESRNMYWRNLCNEFTFSDGSKGTFLSSYAVRSVFVKGITLIKHQEVGGSSLYESIAELGIFDVKAHGPAVTVEVTSSDNICLHTLSHFRPTLFYGDFIFGIRCIGWPQEAREWPMRPRNWPPPAVVQEIMTCGYHVVPKPSITFTPQAPGLQDKKKKKKKKKATETQSLLEYEWRLSYSRAELVLSRHIPPVARACFLALKGTLKRHKNEGGFVISSYQLKTVLYWALEVNPPDLWCEERIEECFMKLVDSLLECMTNKHCSHYFMPQANLMASIRIPFGKQGLLLSKIKANPAYYVSNTSLRCLGNLAAFCECCCYSHGEDVYMDVY